MILESYEQYQLPNGLKIIYTPMSHVRSLAMRFYLNIGSRHETEQEAGASHFLEHMAFKGCQGWPTSREIANAVEDRGGYLNAYTGKDCTVFSIHISTRYWRESLKLLASMTQKPLLNPEDLAQERGVILDEISKYWDNPDARSSLLIDKVMWKDHPLSNPIFGTPESVSALSSKDLQVFHARHYQPEQGILVLAGCMEPENICQAIEKDFGDWQKHATPAVKMPFTSPEHSSPCYHIDHHEGEQAFLRLAVPVPSYQHDSLRYALKVLVCLAGSGTNSRLWQHLREEKGLTYDIGCGTNILPDTGTLEIYCGCKATRLRQVLDSIMVVLRDLQENPITKAELSRVKEYMLSSVEMSGDYPTSVVSWWGSQISMGRELRTFKQITQLIEQVTAESVQQLAQELWNQNKISLVYVGPKREGKILVDWWNKEMA